MNGLKTEADSVYGVMMVFFTFYDELDDVRHLPNDVFEDAGVNAPVRAVQLPNLHPVPADSDALTLLQQL